MSHFAEIDENGIVLRVLVGDNELPNEGLDWFIENLGGTWVQTSYNANFRKNFAGIGFSYDSELDAFIPPKPFNSWVLDEESCQWVAPIPLPEEGEWYWNEELEQWSEIIQAGLSDSPSLEAPTE
jgi:hypothetical protein